MLVIYLGLIYCFIIVNAGTSKQCTTKPIKITETLIDSPVKGEVDKAIYWLPPYDENGVTRQTVLLLSNIGALWRSMDVGENWEKVDLNNTLGVRSISVSPDGKSIILLGFDNHLWNSIDGGKTFRHILTQGYMDELKFHPTQPTWVIAILKRCFTLVPDCSDDLYLSLDLGVTWVLLRRYVWVADWHGISEDEKMIVVWERKEKTGSQMTSPWDSQLITSKTLFRTDPEVIADNIVGYKALGTKIFIANIWTNSSLRLFVSDNYGDTFHAVRFPLGLQENRYTLLDTSEGSSFINVEHSSSNWGNVYTSNSLDTDFVLSLERNVRLTTGKCDFKAVAGLEGIYMANVFVTVADDPIGSGSGKQTYITYDKGARWSRLSVPEGVTCTNPDKEECRLNLIGLSDNGDWYTKKEAIGMIIGNGKISQYFNRPTDLGVYISNDAGWTWHFVADGKHTFGISDRGSYTLIIPDDRATNSMKFSLNKGQTWEDCEFSTDVSVITDIVSDPNSQNGIFIAYGNRGDIGVLYKIDFTPVHVRECQGINNPDSPDSDYEYWEPSDVRGNECLLGRSTKYVRRKQSAECHNPSSFPIQDSIIIKNCSCTEENYECDYCFISYGDTCIPDPECKDYDPKKPPQPCIGIYLETKGYRRVPGDTCDAVSGIDHLPTVKTCPSTPTIDPSSPVSDMATKSDSSVRWGVLMTLLVIAIIVGTVSGIWWYTGRNEKLREFVIRIIPERFLPEIETPGTGVRYTSVNTNFGDEDLEEDAPEIDLDDSEAVTKETE